MNSPKIFPAIEIPFLISSDKLLCITEPLTTKNDKCSTRKKKNAKITRENFILNINTNINNHKLISMNVFKTMYNH